MAEFSGDERGEVLLCCASGEGTHQFKVVADEAGVMAFLEEMCGAEEDGTMTHSLAHYRDEDNWSNGGTAYNVKLYCAEFSVWKVLPGELAFTPSHALPNTQKPGVLATSKEDTLESGLTGRRDGHSALRVKDGKLETFDAHPESAPSTIAPMSVEALVKKYGFFRAMKRGDEANEVFARIQAALASAASATPLNCAGLAIPGEFEQLATFYSVSTLEALIRIQAEHVESLQKKLPPTPPFPGVQRVREG